MEIKNVKMEKQTRIAEPIRTAKDRKAFSRCLKRKSLRNYTLFEFGIRVGRRVSDLINLDIKDVARIDRKGRIIIKNRLQILEKKTQKFANILINDKAQRVLKRYILSRFDTNISPENFLEEPLFLSRQTSRNGERRLSRTQVFRILQQAARDCDFDYKVATHTLRKTFGYALHEDGVDITLIQKAFNHTSPEITLAYIGITQNDMDRALRRLYRRDFTKNFKPLQ